MSMGTYNHAESSWSASSISCPSVGNFGWSNSYCPCIYSHVCKPETEASRAPLCLLPEYMVSRYATVRKAARARFDEIMMSRQDPA